MKEPIDRLLKSGLELDGPIGLSGKLAEPLVPARRGGRAGLGHNCRAARTVEWLFYHGCAGVVLLTDELR